MTIVGEIGDEELNTVVESTAEGTTFEEESIAGSAETDVGTISSVDGTEGMLKLLAESGGLMLL